MPGTDVLGAAAAERGAPGGSVASRRRAVRGMAAFLLAGAALLVAAPPADAQISHAYPGGSMYMEGYFLPPVTATPADPDWTAGGDSLSFSYRGYIWTVPAGGGTARQVTTGPGYHSQPAWSPDGRWLAYTSDVDRNLDVWVLDTRTGERRRITEHGHIDVLPRWSPSGDRILFTSNRGGSFDLWAADPSTGEVRAVTRSEDVNELAGDWLGPERIVFLSDRDGWGHAPLGSGSLFTARVTPTFRFAGGAQEALVSDVRPLAWMETNYHTMPVAEPGGDEVAYVSHATGENDLTLIPGGGGESYRVTRTPDRGELFPAWSPDGERLAYTSNGDGTFGLRVVSRHGGEGREVEVSGFEWTGPTGTLEVRLTDDAGRGVPARVTLAGPDGRALFPRGAYASVVSIGEQYYFQSDGSFRVTVPAGRVRLRAQRGFEYRLARDTVRVEAGETVRLEVPMERWTDMAARGWYAGDNHTHSNYGGHYRVDAAELTHRMRAEDLHVLQDQLANKYTRLLNLEHFTGGPSPASSRERILYRTQEFRPSWSGHVGLLGLEELIYPFFLGYGRTPLSQNHPTNAEVLREARSQGALGGYVHPFLGSEPPEESGYGGARTLPVDAALGLVDWLEVACVWSDEITTARVWYRLLNAGVRVPASAGSDAMQNIWRRPVMGATRVYVDLGERGFTYDRWMEGLAAGRSFVTSGPILTLDVAGGGASAGMGGELRLESGERVTVEATARSIFPVDSVQVLWNGEPVRTVRPEGGVPGDGVQEVRIDAEVPAEASGWVAVRALGPAGPGVMDTRLFAHTNPVWVVADGEPVRSPEDARYFVRWIDRVAEMVRSDTSRWTPEAKERLLDQFDEARAVYGRQFEQRAPPAGDGAGDTRDNHDPR